MRGAMLRCARTLHRVRNMVEWKCRDMRKTDFMEQYVTEDDVRRIAEYARIGLTEEEVASSTVDLNSIIETLQPIKNYDLQGVEPTFHPIGSLSNVMREDVEGISFTQEVALSNAPACQDGYFLIPSILGEGGDR